MNTSAAARFTTQAKAAAAQIDAAVCPRRLTALVAKELNTITKATGPITPSTDTSLFGSTMAKMAVTAETSSTFSVMYQLSTGCQAGSGGATTRSRSMVRSTSTVNAQSGAGSLGRTARTATTAPAATTPISTTNHRFSPMALAHDVSSGTPNTSSLMKSVKSSFAMWIHHSWGNLMKTQMDAAM